MLNLDFEQKSFVETVVAVCLCAGFVIGYASCIVINKSDEPKVGEIQKRDEAIAFFTSHNDWRYAMCNGQPMDGDRGMK